MLRESAFALGNLGSSAGASQRGLIAAKVSLFEFGVALAQNVRVVIDQLQVLLEFEEMFGLPGAGQGFGNLIFTGFAAGEARGGPTWRGSRSPAMMRE